MTKADLLFSEEFRAYRKEELNAGVGIVRDFLKGQHTPDYAQGALEMLKAIMFIPKNFALNDKQRQQLNLLINKDFDDFHFELVRRFLESE